MENFFDANGTLTIICFVFFILSFFIQLFFYSVYYRRAYIKTEGIEPKKRTVKDPVSIIICARNEAHNLKKNLPLILEQDYKNFEVIVVDDRSEDDTGELLSELAAKYSNLIVSKVKNAPQFTYGKKLALLLGIKASSYEWLLFTDADCYPSGKKWLSQMQKNFNKQTEIVIGYGGYKKEPGLINLITRFETAFSAMSYFGMARAGKPYMGVGRNLAYRKSLFFKNNGFASHTGLQSGDDDLFINETANAGNTAIEMHPDSFTWSEAEKEVTGWFRQRRRHLTTGPRYKTRSKYRLILENLSRMLLLITFFILIVMSSFPIFILAAFLGIYIFKIIIIKIVFTGLNEKYLFIPSIFLEPVMPFFHGFIHFRNFIEKNRTQWK